LQKFAENWFGPQINNFGITCIRIPFSVTYLFKHTRSHFYFLLWSGAFSRFPLFSRRRCSLRWFPKMCVINGLARKIVLGMPVLQWRFSLHSLVVLFFEKWLIFWSFKVFGAQNLMICVFHSCQLTRTIDVWLLSVKSGFRTTKCRPSLFAFTFIGQKNCLVSDLSKRLGGYDYFLRLKIFVGDRLLPLTIMLFLGCMSWAFWMLFQEALPNGFPEVFNKAFCSFVLISICILLNFGLLDFDWTFLDIFRRQLAYLWWRIYLEYRFLAFTNLFFVFSTFSQSSRRRKCSLLRLLLDYL